MQTKWVKINQVKTILWMPGQLLTSKCLGMMVLTCADTMSSPCFLHNRWPKSSRHKLCQRSFLDALYGEFRKVVFFNGLSMGFPTFANIRTQYCNMICLLQRLPTSTSKCQPSETSGQTERTNLCWAVSPQSFPQHSGSTTGWNMTGYQRSTHSLILWAMIPPHDSNQTCPNHAGLWSQLCQSSSPILHPTMASFNNKQHVYLCTGANKGQYYVLCMCKCKYTCYRCMIMHVLILERLM